jgi:predicted GNAT family N-acyltransferase
MTLVLDSGALIALEKNDRAMWRRLKSSLVTGEAPVSHGGVIAQAWRGGGPRQALLAKALAAIDVRALDESLALAAGELLADTGGSDVIDAAVVLLAYDGDDIVTSDTEDLQPLAAQLGRHVELVRV